MSREHAVNFNGYEEAMKDIGEIVDGFRAQPSIMAASMATGQITRRAARYLRGVDRDNPLWNRFRNEIDQVIDTEFGEYLNPAGGEEK